MNEDVHQLLTPAMVALIKADQARQEALQAFVQRTARLEANGDFDLETAIDTQSRLVFAFPWDTRARQVLVTLLRVQEALALSATPEQAGEAAQATG